MVTPLPVRLRPPCISAAGLPVVWRSGGWWAKPAVGRTVAGQARTLQLRTPSLPSTRPAPRRVQVSEDCSYSVHWAKLTTLSPRERAKPEFFLSPVSIADHRLGALPAYSSQALTSSI